MYLSEILYEEHVEILKKEGFPVVYVWQDEPGFIYEEHFHKEKVSFFIEKGGVSFTFEDGINVTMSQGQRFDVPIGKKHSALVSDSGCIYTVGQMSENDA